YLGRAHPLVRHAIDRVRHTSLGDGAGFTDSRAAVVNADVSEPTLYCTFLSRVNSVAGREYERVVAVRITRSGEPTYCPEPGEWLELALLDAAMSPSGVWEEQFAAWATSQKSAAVNIAADAFAATGQTFIADAQAAIARETADLDKWLAERVA